MSEESSTRRGRRRRRSGGFSTGGVSQSTDGARSASEEETEALEDMPTPRDLNAEAARRTAQRASEPAPEEQETDLGDEFSPQGRMREVGSRATAYEKEYRLKLLHRMLLRNVPMDKIAEELGLSLSQVKRDRNELHRLLRESAKQLDINGLVGDSMGFYNEVMSMALRMASQKKAPGNIKLAAMRTALTSRNDMHRFLQTSGVYDVLRYRVAEEAQAGGDITKMVELTKMILDMQEDETVEDLELDKFSFEDLGLGDQEDDEDDRLVQLL